MNSYMVTMSCTICVHVYIRVLDVFQSGHGYVLMKCSVCICIITIYLSLNVRAYIYGIWVISICVHLSTNWGLFGGLSGG